MKSLCFFDLETRNLFEDIDPKYPTLSFSEKDNIKRILAPKLGLATACVLVEGSKPEVFHFDEGQETELIETLNNFDLIVGHNILHFDYLVISPYFQGDLVAHFLPRTKDTLDELRRVTNGCFIGLDDLAKQNLGLNKTLDSKTIPGLWRSGEKEKVRQYCKNDVELLRRIYFLGKERGRLRYTIKKYGEAIGVGEACIPW
jgi:hypothetical protein